VVPLENNTNKASSSDSSKGIMEGSCDPPSLGKWPSYLHKLVSEERDDTWNNVLARIQSHPVEVMSSGVYGQSALHAACVRYPPIEVVNAMLEVNPKAAAMQNKDGETPLHLASYGASEEVQQALVCAAPECVQLVDKYGDSPLHLVTRSGGTLELLTQIVQASPETISVTNKRGVTPFFLLSRTYLEAESLEALEAEDGDFADDWKKSKMFLVRSAQHSGREFRLVHEAAHCSACPRDLLSLLCRLYPYEALEYDEHGKTPLALGATAEVMEEPAEWDENEDGFREDIDLEDDELLHGDHEIQPNNDGNAALQNFGSDNLNVLANEEHEQKVENKNDKESLPSVLEILVQWNPQAASMADKQGRLPLAHALVSGKSWTKGVNNLLMAAPRSLETRDILTHLYPFQLAAVHARDIDTIYALVRSLPELVVATGISVLGANDCIVENDKDNFELNVSKRTRRRED